MLTPAALDALLAHYEAMAEAARANDWERLTAVEREAAALRLQLQADADAANDADALSQLPPAEAAALRAAVDAMEIIVEREAWPVPTYNEILFYA